MAQPNPTQTVTNPRIAKLIELEVAGRIKPEHQVELDTYRAQGLAPKKSSGNSLTEYQGKSTGFYERAAGADKDFLAAGNFKLPDGSVQDGTTPVGYGGDIARELLPENMVNSHTSPARQMAQQAKKDFILASLRYESGAAISPSELSKQDAVFFPQTGDSDEVIKQKAAARQRVIESLKVAAGPGATDKALGINDAVPPPTNPPQEEVGLGEAAHRAIDDVASPNGGPIKVEIDQPSARQSPEFRAGLNELLDKGASKQDILDYWEKNAPGALQGGNAGTDIADRAAKDVAEQGGGAVGSALRGAADTISLGFADELGAGVRALTADKPTTFADELRFTRAVKTADEAAHPWAYPLGQLAGAVAMPVGAEARGAAEMAKVGGGMGALYGVGSGNSLGDRFVGGVKGAAAGAAGGVVLGKLSDLYMARPPRNPGGGGPEAADRFSVRQAAERQGVDIMPADVGGPLVGRMTAGTAQSPYGVTRIVNAGKKAVESFRDARDRLAGGSPPVREIGETVQAVEQRGLDRAANAVRDSRDAVTRNMGPVQDATGAGQIAQRGARRFMDETSDRATKLYRRIPIEPAAESVVSNTVGALMDMTSGMDSNPKLSAMFQSPRLKAYLDALTPEDVEIPVPPKVMPGGSAINQPPIIQKVGGKLSWDDLSEFRTRVGDMLDDPRLSEKIAPRQLRTLYAALSKDMQATARKEGPEAYKAWKRANDYYDGRQKRIDGPIALLLGQRKDATANEAYAQIERLAREAAGGDFAKFGQVLRSLPKADADIIRSTVVSRAGDGPDGFTAKGFAKAWGDISDRAKSYLVPQSGMRQIMDEAATRAQDIEAKGALSGKSGEAVFDAVEKMAMNRGDSRRFNAMVQSLSPDEATALRSKLIKRMGEATPGAQNAEGDAFSPARWLTRWNEFTPEAKATIFGDGELRSAMDDLAKVADNMKQAQKYANTSGSAGAISVDKTNTGLAGAAVALLTGHPIVAAALASPAAIQNISSRLLTSPRMVRWLAAAPKMQTREASLLHIRRLSNIATRDPTIRNEVIQLQQKLMSAVNDNANVGSAAASGEQGQGEKKRP
jgi:hypothetical protein